MYFTVWVVVYVIPACSFFMNVSMKRLLSAYFDKHIFLFFFYQNTSCFLRLYCQLDWQNWLSLYCSYLYQFLELNHHDCLDLLRDSLLIGFFKSTNSFKRQLSSRRNNVKLLSNESTLWTIFWIIENELAFIYHWSLDTVDLQRPDWICRSSFTTYRLISGKEISCLFTILRGNKQASSPIRLISLKVWSSSHDCIRKWRNEIHWGYHIRLLNLFHGQ